jgi:hypothetical protein
MTTGTDDPKTDDSKREEHAAETDRSKSAPSTAPETNDDLDDDQVDFESAQSFPASDPPTNY